MNASQPIWVTAPINNDNTKKLCPYSLVFHNAQRILGKGRIKDMTIDVQSKISIDIKEMRYKTIRVSDAQPLQHHITQQSKRNQETNYQ